MFTDTQKKAIVDAEEKYPGIENGCLPDGVYNNQPEYMADFARWKALGILPPHPLHNTGWRLVPPGRNHGL